MTGRQHADMVTDAGAATVPYDLPRDLEWLLADSLILLAQFRARLRESGYPFREPCDTARVMHDLGMIVDSAEEKRNTRNKAVGT